MDRILEVKNLKVSFRTQAGTLKAVRGISLDLERGRTLAIVGESGSGKSVTAKAMLGILAGNTIIEGGEILYDGKDLLQISEDDFHTIRGDKISMIFQDPLSSLDPIVKIGRQITEAMLLKSKTNRREARKDFNTLLGKLNRQMAEAENQGGKSGMDAMTRTFDKTCIESNHLENSYNQAFSKASDLLSYTEDFLFKAEKKQKLDAKKLLSGYRKNLKGVSDRFLTRDFEERISEVSQELGKAAGNFDKKSGDLTEAVSAMQSLEKLLQDITAQQRPDFYRIGFYKLNDANPQMNQPLPSLQKAAEDCINEKFMPEFRPAVIAGVRHSYEQALEKKKDVLPELEEARVYFSGNFEKSDALKRVRELSDKVEASIDQLEYIKDSRAYTFRSSLGNAVKNYFKKLKQNVKEEARFAKQSRRRDALIARGRHVTWEVIPKVVCEKEELRANILTVLDRMKEHYEDYIRASGSMDMERRSSDLIDHFKNKASQVVSKITKTMAKERAIKLMEEVGIHEPRLRYNQYPFEFSGGMRQRIVIAIALAADPDLLICDEPTTALDVTIQSQILELINRLKAERGLSIIFITHDLGVVANMADDIAVMYAGKIVEYGTADDIFYDPRHPYTWALLSSMPDLDTKDKLDAIPGTPPNMIYPPKGDAFAQRNKYAMKIDFEEHPPFFKVSDTHYAATWLLHPDAPKVEMPKMITDRIRRMQEKLERGVNHA